MKEFITAIGILLFSLFMYAIPIVLTLSFALNWDGYVQFVLVLIAIIQLALICAAIQFIMEQEEKA